VKFSKTGTDASKFGCMLPVRRVITDLFRGVITDQLLISQNTASKEHSRKVFIQLYFNELKVK
jgi:hypothetical protein